MLEDLWTRVAGDAVYARSGIGVAPRDAPAVVLVHGIGVTGRYLEPTMEALAPHLRVYAPDLPGWGRSDRPPRALTIPEVADALAGWLDVVGIESPTLLANSMGCQVVVDLVARSRGRADRLVLVGPTVDPASRTMPRQAARLALDSLREPPSLVALIAADYLRFGPLRFLATARHALDDRIEQKLPLVEAPTLVVRGTRDALVSQEWATDAARLLPRGELATVPGRAHAVNYNAPLALGALVRDFIART
ncbi:MAG: alpha/beta hydrolase [Actinobacteria bacterium]|nr:alpha/beta hydrolase [Actinomycetota bacterium]